METRSRPPLQLLLPLDDTITVFTAARIVGVAPSTIRRWCEARRFPAWKYVGDWKIDRRAFLDWRDSRRQQ